MSFPSYPEYKESGMSWLGEVPGHWVTAKIKHTYKFSTGWTPPSGQEDYYGNDHLWANISDLGERYIGTTAKGISNLAVRELDMAVSPAGSLLFSFKLSIGLMSFTTTPMFTNEAIASFQPDHSHSLQFAYYAFPIYIVANATENIYGAKMLNQERIRSAQICLPSLAEQHAIAAFLDRETAKIDALVAEQERLIALLKEKRQAVISHAVTKGLNPDAPMKDSGIEWLGEIPAHWEVVKIVRLFRASKGKEGQLLTKEYCAEHAGEFPVYSGQTENAGIMGTLDRYEFDAGDQGYLFSTTVGAKAMTVSHIFGKFSLSQNCMIIRPSNPSVDPRFFYYHFQPVFGYHRSLIPDHMQPSFRMEDLYGFAVALPPEPERAEIAQFLDEALNGYDRLTDEAQAAITLLQERRAALISAAVTGKIDVRGLVDQQELEAA